MILHSHIGAFKLTICRYPLPDPQYDRHYDNWLTIQVDVEHPCGSWIAQGQYLLPSEVKEFCAWITEPLLAQPKEIDFLEPELAFTLEPREQTSAVLRIYIEYGLRPPWLHKAAYQSMYLDFSVTPTARTSIARDVQAQLQKFIERGK